MGTTPPKPLKILPLKVAFSNNYADDQKTHIRLSNETEKIVAYRLRTTMPAFYRMPNADGFIEPGQHKDLEILLKKNFQWDREKVNNHKMMAMTLCVFEDDFRNQKPISEIFKDGMEPKKVDIPVYLQPPPGTMEAERALTPDGK